MKTKLICTTLVYMSLIFLALSKSPSLISESLILGSTLFYGLYSIFIITNNQNITKNK